MSTDINEFQRRAQRKELDKIAREVLYSLAVQLRDLLKDDNAIDLSHVYLVLDKALQQLFERGIAVTGSTKMFGKINYGCPHFESLKNLPQDAPLPDKCSTCPKLMECFTKRTEV